MSVRRSAKVITAGHLHVYKRAKAIFKQTEIAWVIDNRGSSYARRTLKSPNMSKAPQEKCHDV